MARQKQIKYIQLDVDMREDSKIMKLCYYIDDDADIIFVEFLRAIFKEKNYYIQFDSDLFVLIARRRKKWTIEVIQAIFDKCIELNLFDKNLFEKHGILTSKSIQARFFQTGESSNWRNITIIKEYFLLENLEEFTNKKCNIYEVRTLNSVPKEDFNSDLKPENIPKNDFKSDLKSENATKNDFKSDLSALKEYNKKDLDKSKSNLNHPQPPKAETEEDGDFEKWFSHYPCDWETVNNPKSLKRCCQREWNALKPADRKACTLFLENQIAALENSHMLSPTEIQSRLSAAGLSPYPLPHLRNRGFYAAQKSDRPRSVDRKSKTERAQQAMQNAYTKRDLEHPFVLTNKVIEC